MRSQKIRERTLQFWKTQNLILFILNSKLIFKLYSLGWPCLKGVEICLPLTLAKGVCGFGESSGSNSTDKVQKYRHQEIFVEILSCNINAINKFCFPSNCKIFNIELFRTLLWLICPFRQLELLRPLSDTVDSASLAERISILMEFPKIFYKIKLNHTWLRLTRSKFLSYCFEKNPFLITL